MGIALLAIADIWMPLQSLASRLITARRGPGFGLRGERTESVDGAAGLRYVSVRPARVAPLSHGSHSAHGSHVSRHVPAAPVATAVRPLRVVRLVDSQGAQRHSSNRVVISGRMADVCAELDRLAAIEALEAAEAANTMPRSTHLH